MVAIYPITLHTSESKYEAASAFNQVDSDEYGTFIFDGLGRILGSGSAAKELFGAGRGRLTGLHISSLFPGIDLRELSPSHNVNYLSSLCANRVWQQLLPKVVRFISDVCKVSGGASGYCKAASTQCDGYGFTQVSPDKVPDDVDINYEERCRLGVAITTHEASCARKSNDRNASTCLGQCCYGFQHLLAFREDARDNKIDLIFAHAQHIFGRTVGDSHLMTILHQKLHQSVSKSLIVVDDQNVRHGQPPHRLWPRPEEERYIELAIASVRYRT
jgi:hypothetical protein